MNTRQTGNVYEQMAADYLEKQGMRILERNFRRGRNGEIDIIGRDGKYLVFVEVKYRSGDEKGNAAEAVTTAKQRTICRVADYYRYLHHYGEDTWVRYDVVESRGRHFTGFQMLFHTIIVQGDRIMYPLIRTDCKIGRASCRERV